ncbi:MAG: hypothetical protein H0U57_10305, partial [Tatlockia sp.]|nr:hypothetical protein [Tatlockia sp.]
MNETTRHAISQLLRERVALTQSNHEAPHDYVSVIECILQAELKQEITALESMLFDLETFEEHFKERCALRETDIEHAFVLSSMPESLSNQLYCEIALLVFQPKNMKDILEIMAPSITQHLKVDLSYSPIHSSRQDIQVMGVTPTLQLSHTLDAFENEEPKIEAFTHYVLSDSTLLNAKEISQFPLMLQAKLQSMLTDEHPVLAKQLVGHNSSLNVLSQDILALNNKGTTPKAAIEQLILGLTVGGAKMTAKEFAGKSARKAVKRFFAYFNALPIGIKEQLRALQDHDITLGHIIDEEIGKGQCVETTATHLARILRANSNETLLTSPPELSPQAVKELKNKYGPKHELDTKKDASLVLALPVQLAHEVIGRIAPTTDEDLMTLLLDFPPVFYDTLWQHITLHNPANAFNN